MASARAYGLVQIRNMAQLVTVEADIDEGLPATVFKGMPDDYLREMRDRVRAAIINGGERWPMSKLTLRFSPARLGARPSSLDLTMAIAILGANGDIPCTAPARTVYMSELGLDGRLRPVPQFSDVLTAIRQAGLPESGDGVHAHTVITAADMPATTEAAELCPIPRLEIITAADLAHAVALLRP